MKINENNIVQNKESVYECWQLMLCTLLYGHWRGPSHVSPLLYLLLVITWVSTCWRLGNPPSRCGAKNWWATVGSRIVKKRADSNLSTK